MIRRSWRTHLKNTTAAEGVLTLVSHYLDEWTPQEIAMLPPGAWPGALRSKADLIAHASRLAQLHGEFVGAPSSLAGLQELLLFFTHACVRMMHLATIAQHGVEDPSGGAPRESRFEPATAHQKPVADGDR